MIDSLNPITTIRTLAVQQQHEAESSPPELLLPPIPQAARVPVPAERRDPQLVGRQWSATQHIDQLVKDLKEVLGVLEQLPPAVTFFGGARIKEDDPFYAMSKELGRLLAGHGIPPRTGGGPGIMTSVLEGFAEGIKQLERGELERCVPARLLGGVSPEASLDDLRGQAVRILLPWEDPSSGPADVSAYSELFPFRKYGLYENSRGLVTFPGGFGTLDELFEVWSLSQRKKHNDPMVVVGTSFWKPLLGAIEKVAVNERKLIAAADFQRVKVSDDAGEVVDHISQATHVRGFEEEPSVALARMTSELAIAGEALAGFEPAVTVIGGRDLEPDDPTLSALTSAVSNLVAGGKQLRVTGRDAVAEAVRVGAGDQPLQRVLLGEDDDHMMMSDAVVVSDLITHRELMTRKMEALIVTPGGLGTFDTLFTTLCEMQTGKRERVPVVLVGSDFWQPIFDAIKESMLSSDRQTIAAEDLDLVTIVDHADEITAAIAG